MKLRTKKIMAVLMVGAISTGTFAVGAANLTRNAELRYNNINVQVDGQIKSPKMEPFFIGDSVYVSLRDAGQLIGSSVNWNGSTNTVEINTSSIATPGLEAELATKNHELAVAKAEMQKMQEKIAAYEKQLNITEDKENDKTTDKDNDKTAEKLDLKDTLKLLERRYDDKYDIEWDLRLTGNEEKINFKMYYDSKQDGKKFKAISKTNLEKLTKDIMKDIQSECGKIKVEGEIYDTKERTTMAEFSISAKGAFDFEYKRDEVASDKDLKDFTKIIADNYSNFPALNFGGVFDGGAIRVRDITLTKEADTIEFNVFTDYAKMDLAKRAWTNMDATAKNLLEEYMEDIQNDIENEFDVNVKGYVYNENKEIIATHTNRIKIN